MNNVYLQRKVKYKVKFTSICIALYHDSSLKHSGMARVNSFTCHPHVYPQVAWTTPAFTPQLQSITALWLVLISRPAEGRRLSYTHDTTVRYNVTRHCLHQTSTTMWRELQHSARYYSGQPYLYQTLVASTTTGTTWADRWIISGIRPTMSTVPS